MSMFEPVVPAPVAVWTASSASTSGYRGGSGPLRGGLRPGPRRRPAQRAAAVKLPIVATRWGFQRDDATARNAMTNTIARGNEPNTAIP